MKTAGYDIALLLNERFLNQLSGALFYSGFLTINGSVDMYNGTLSLEHQVMDYNKSSSQNIQGKVPVDMQPFMKMDFRFKLTQEPLICFESGDSVNNQQIRVALAMRIYFWLWEGLELKFDANISLLVPISIGSDMKLVADFSTADIEELTLKYGGGMKPQMMAQMDAIVENAMHMYFANHVICQRLELPCLSAVIKDIKDYITPDKDNEGKDLGIIPIHIDAIRVVTDTVMVIGINLMDYYGGSPDKLHDFAKNCSIALAISETAIFKVFKYVWTHSQFNRTIGSKGDLCLVKNKDSLSVSKAGTFEVEKLDKFFDKATEIVSFIGNGMTKILTAGIVGSSIDYQGMDFYYDVNVTLKNEPKFDLLGGNIVYIYNMAFSAYFRLSCDCTYKYEVTIDTSPGIPNSWTPWDDEITLYEKTKTVTLFDQHIRIDNLELQYAKGILLWDKTKQSLVIKVIEIKPYWNLDKPGSPLENCPAKLRNWITNAIEAQIVKRIPEFTVSTKLNFNLPYIPWPMKMNTKELEVTNSEVIIAADLEFEQLKKDIYPVPKYVVNINNKEIHKIGCDSVMDIYEVHQRSYHLLNDALNKGYDGCKNCLPVFHKR
ncbi:MAG: hypothetical protein WBL93_11165 [Lutisporaceae bacterium]